MSGKHAVLIVKIMISLAALYVLSMKMDMQEIKIIYSNINIWYCFASICLYIVAQMLSTLRWSMLVGTKHGFVDLLKIYYIGCFFNNFLPSTIGGDAVKAYYLYRRGGGLHSSMASVFMDRYMGLTALVLIGVISFIAGYGLIGGTYIAWLYPVMVAGFITGSVVVFRTRWAMFFKQTRMFYESIVELKGMRRVITRGFLISIAVQILTVLSVYLISKSIGSGVGLLECGIFIPLINIITLVPVSISGVGIREGAFVYMFGLTGVSNTEAVTISLIWFVTVAMVNLVGGLFYLRLGSEDKKHVDRVDG